jgi:hypothetical protein
MRFLAHLKQMGVFRSLSILNSVIMVLALLSHDWFFLAVTAVNTIDTLAWAIWESRR